MEYQYTYCPGTMSNEFRLTLVVAGVRQLSFASAKLFMDTFVQKVRELKFGDYTKKDNGELYITSRLPDKTVVMGAYYSLPQNAETTLKQKGWIKMTFNTNTPIN